MEFSYDSALVALSLGLAILGCFTGLVVTAGMGRASGREAAMHIVLGGIAIGSSLWAMHFVAMLAIILPVELSYNFVETALSGGISVISTIAALALVNRGTFGKYTLPACAVLLGATTVAMHYLGMDGMRGNFVLNHSSLGVIIIAMIAVQASAAVLWFVSRERAVIDTFLGAIALGLALASIHYAGLEAGRFLPSEVPGADVRSLFSDYSLALAVAVTIYSICGACILIFAGTAFARRAAQRHVQILSAKPALSKPLAFES